MSNGEPSTEETASAAGEPGGGGGPHVFVGDLDAPELQPDDDHHLRRSLRVRDGDPLTASDGRGRWRPCRFGSQGLEPAGDIVAVARPEPTITVGFAIIKRSRPELVVQKLTEAGVDTIAPVTAARAVVKWDEAKQVRQRDRWQRIAREAAMQSRRVWLPDVLATAPIETAFDAADQPAALAHPAGGAALEVRSIFVGPEGGWTPDELHGRATVRLARHVLRAETAAIVAAALLGAVRERIVYAPRW